MTALQSLSAPHGWKDGPPDHRGPDYRSWETTGGLRAIVAARALGGCRRGWYRVWAAAICGGGEVRATVRGEHLQATVEAVCGWALAVASSVR